MPSRRRHASLKRLDMCRLARECGVEETNCKLWYAVHLITKDEDSMEFFIGTSTPEGRLAFIEHFAEVNNLN